MKILLLLVWSSVTLIKGNSQLISWDTDLNHKETLSNGFCKIQDSKKDHLLITSNEEIVQSFRCKRDTNRFGRKGPYNRQRFGARFGRPGGGARQLFRNQERGGGFFKNRDNDHGAFEDKVRERYDDNHRTYEHSFDGWGSYENWRDNWRTYGVQNDDRSPYRDRDNDRELYRGGRGGERRPNQDRGGDQKPYQGRDRDGRLQQGTGGDSYQDGSNFHGLNFNVIETFKRFSELPSLEKCLQHLNLQCELKQEKQKCIEETRKRKTYQALLDFNNLIKNLLKECYPAWGPYRSDDDFSLDVWMTMFLNIEHQRVLTIKRILKQGDVTEQTFADVVMEFYVPRKYDDMNELKLSPLQRIDIYPEFLRPISNTKRIVISAVLEFINPVYFQKNEIQIKQKPIFSAIDMFSKPTGKIEDTLTREIIKETERKRENLTLLIINTKQDYNWGPTESDIESEIKQEIAETDLLACLKLDVRVFLLFKNFNAAYKSYKHFANREFRNRKEYLITDVNSTSTQLFESNQALLQLQLQPLYLSDEPIEKWNGWEEVQKFFYKRFKIDNMLRLKNNKNTIFIKMTRLNDILIAYQEVKTIFSSEVSVAIIAESVSLGSLIPVTFAPTTAK